MAGSWEHMNTLKGELRNNETFVDMIDNLGDAYEAAEECYGMIWWLAGQVVNLTGSAGESYPPARERCLEVIRQAMDHHLEGLDMGGVQGD